MAPVSRIHLQISTLPLLELNEYKHLHGQCAVWSPSDLVVVVEPSNSDIGSQ